MEIMELTIEKIIEFAKENNKRFEAYTPFLSRWNDRLFGNTQIGVELEPNIWFWFEQFEMDGYITFSHRYNQKNGHTMKSFKQGWKAEKIILK